MAHHHQYSGVVSVTAGAVPVPPSRRKTTVQYGRSSSDSSADLASFSYYAAMPIGQQQQQQHNSVSGANQLAGLNNNKPPPVPRTSLIRSQTAAEVIHHKVIKHNFLLFFCSYIFVSCLKNDTMRFIRCTLLQQHELNQTL